MLSQGEALLVGVALVAAGIAAIVTSIIILRKGKLYHSLKPESRPRRWVLFACLILFGVWIVAFPLWLIWPHALAARVLLMIFALTFFVVGVTMRWFSGLVDWYYERRGWPLR